MYRGRLDLPAKTSDSLLDPDFPHTADRRLRNEGAHRSVRYLRLRPSGTFDPYEKRLDAPLSTTVVGVTTGVPRLREIPSGRTVVGFYGRVYVRIPSDRPVLVYSFWVFGRHPFSTLLFSSVCRSFSCDRCLMDELLPSPRVRSTQRRAVQVQGTESGRRVRRRDPTLGPRLSPDPSRPGTV